MFIDTHAHIYSEEFEEDLDNMILSSLQQGITDIYMPNIDSTSLDRMLHIQNVYPSTHAMVGLHPCYVKENYKSELQTMEKYLENHTFCAVGEIGIDLYWDTTFASEQEEAYRRQIEIARNARLPIVMHSRESLDITINTVKELQDGSLTGIFHCFNGNLDQAKAIIDLGFYMGIGGVITYKNAGVAEVVSQIDLEYLVLETDAPYLSPVPHRGKRNEPSYIKLIAQKLAEIKHVDISEIATVTTFNANKVFATHHN
jgi:TatD DNase family protein